MIDCESTIFQMCADAFRAEYPNGFITPEYVAKPSVFPAVMVQTMSNTVVTRAVDNGSVENAANVMVQVDIYSNRNSDKKAQAKAIAELIDAQLKSRRFERTYMNPVPNFNGATIYRITARYERQITDQETI